MCGSRYASQMYRFALLMVVGLLCACATPTASVGAPTVLGTSDVIWVVRQVDAPSESADKYTESIYGLFACYRPPPERPGAPTCYLAKTVWTPEDLGWPGRVRVTREGRVIVAPPETPPK